MALDLAQWRVFLAAADQGSLIKAAEVLHTDQPALSRSLRRLEVLIGAPLFLRSSRGLTLTELGRRLREPVRELVDQATTVEALAHAEARQISGILRVGAVDVYPMTAVIATACRDLTVAGRPVTVDVIGLPWLAHVRAVRERSIDVGFTLTVAGRLPDPSIMRSQPLWDEPETFALIASHHPLADADLIDPRDLADLPLHLPDKADNPDIYNLILEQLADAGVASPRRAPPLGTFATVIAHIAAGSGWSLSARTLARQTPRGIAARPLAVTPRHTVRFELIWHINTDPDTIATFAQRVQDALADHHLT
jgi:LysR family hca operon transcriptional activator